MQHLHRIHATLILLGALASAASQAQSASASYAIDWDVIDGGGGTALSASYTMTDSVAQAGALGESVSASYRLEAGFLAPPDFDGDGVRNFMDNCVNDANADQRDTDADGFGNACDTDLNNDGITNVIDLGLLRQRFFTADPDADFNGDGIVNVVDLGLLRLRFFTAPGR